MQVSGLSLYYYIINIHGIPWIHYYYYDSNYYYHYYYYHYYDYYFPWL